MSVFVFIMFYNLLMSYFKDLETSADKAAQRLLGCELERVMLNGEILRVRIVETEAYDQNDPASHSSRGQTARNSVMFGPPGFLYVYFIYGMHYCCNISTGPDGFGEAALIRAVEPIIGKEIMSKNRKNISGVNITNGPAKTCEALLIDKTLNSHDLSESPLKLIMKPSVAARDIVQTTRIGIKKGAETPWRFYLRNNPYVSAT